MRLALLPRVPFGRREIGKWVPIDGDGLGDRRGAMCIAECAEITDQPIAHWWGVNAGRAEPIGNAFEGSSIKVTNKGGVMVDKARVIKTDIEADNGVIHVIDTVMLPSGQ